jgi:hypothetical protein
MQGCQIFIGTTYQNGEKFTTWPQNLPNGRNICKQNENKNIIIYQNLPLQAPPKFTQIGISGFKICHLSTLIVRHEKHFEINLYMLLAGGSVIQILRIKM